MLRSILTSAQSMPGTNLATLLKSLVSNWSVNGAVPDFIFLVSPPLGFLTLHLLPIEGLKGRIIQSFYSLEYGTIQIESSVFTLNTDEKFLILPKGIYYFSVSQSGLEPMPESSWKPTLERVVKHVSLKFKQQ